MNAHPDSDRWHRQQHNPRQHRKPTQLGTETKGHFRVININNRPVVCSFVLFLLRTMRRIAMALLLLSWILGGIRMGVQHLVQFSNRETYVGAAAHFHLQQKKLLVSQILVNHICMPCPSPVSHRLKNVGTRRNPVHSVTEARLPDERDQ